MTPTTRDALLAELVNAVKVLMLTPDSPLAREQFAVRWTQLEPSATAEANEIHAETGEAS
jgi:hypothetical protein